MISNQFWNRCWKNGFIPSIYQRHRFCHIIPRSPGPGQYLDGKPGTPHSISSFSPNPSWCITPKPPIDLVSCSSKANKCPISWKNAAKIISSGHGWLKSQDCPNRCSSKLVRIYLRLRCGKNDADCHTLTRFYKLSKLYRCATLINLSFDLPSASAAIAACTICSIWETGSPI